MFLNFILRKMNFAAAAARAGTQTAEEPPARPVPVELSESVERLRQLLGGGSDLKIHNFETGPAGCVRGALVFIDGLVDQKLIVEGVLRPLSLWRRDGPAPDPAALARDASAEALGVGDAETARTLDAAQEGVFSGDTAILFDGCPEVLVVSTKGWEKRGVSEPESETVVRGPREGFTENLRTNTALVRRKLKCGALRSERMTAGRRTHTEICLMYLADVADPRVVDEMRRRIGSLDVDAILESGYIEEYIEDAPFSPFATIGNTEKPDVAAAKILEGRVAVFVDGTPFVLTAPMLFIESFQTTEDYYTRPMYASLIRLLRFMGFFLTVFMPSVYIALTAFHQQLIPTTLLFTIANAREGTPFPVFIEAFIMLFAFEVLREAGIRLPRPVGQAISIVGALVMGDAAVSAGLVGAPVVITIALTAVSSFLVPSQNDAASILRLLTMILAALVGGYGVAMGLLAMLLHLGSLSSFGVPFFNGFYPNRDLQDSFIRMPLWSMRRRPVDIAENDVVRRPFFVPPLRPFENPDDVSEVPNVSEDAP